MNKQSQRELITPYAGRVMFIIINILVWVLILSFPFIMATRDGSLVRLDHYLIYSWIPVMFLLVFYFNYYFLIDKLIFEKRRWITFFASNAGLIIVVSTCSHVVQGWYLARVTGENMVVEPEQKIELITYILRDGIVLMLVVALSVAIKMVVAWMGHENERNRLESEKHDAELRNLRSQLNPHFLFNTLNNIYSLTASDPEKARRAIHSLSNIMRYILYDSQSMVPLDKELDFLRSYIGLMSLRQSQNMVIETTFPKEGQGVMIAPLMFMTLVENGFKHGVSPTEPSFVRIAISLREGQRGEHTITCKVENSFHPKTDTDRSGSGIGNENLRRRLALLYPKHHHITSEHVGETYIAQLTINL
jgi:two-component sensor histidine kinase